MNLKQLREERGITQTELARQLGVVRSTICFYESGQHSPTPDMLIKLADFFGVSVDYLLGREDEYAARVPGGIAAPVGDIANEEERELLALFRELSPYLKGLALQTVRNWAGKPGKPGAIDLQKKA